MRFPRKRGAASVKTRIFIPDNSATNGAGLTGLTYGSTNLAVAYSRENDNGGTEVTGANLLDITTIGTWQDPTAGKLRIKAVDATKMPGLYEIHFPDAAAFGTGDTSQNIICNVYEKTTTALKIGPNMVMIPLSARNVLDGESDVVAFLGTVLTETVPGYIAAAFKKVYDVLNATMTALSLPSAIPGAAGGAFIAGTNAPVVITGAGDALTLLSASGNGSGLVATGQGSGDGVKATKGTTGVDIRGAITGNVTGTVSKSPATLAAADVSGNLAADVKAWNGGALPTIGDATAAELAKVPKSDAAVTWNSTALASVNAEVDAALNTAIPGTPTTDSINERVKAIDDLTQASGSGDLAVVKTTVSTNLDTTVGSRLAPGGTLAIVTTLTNAPPDSAGVTTLLARLGAFTGTGWNTVLGFLRAMLRKDVGVTLPTDIGGTFDPATDSTEAIRDTAPLGTAMRGTDGATLASMWTDTKAGYIDAAISTRTKPADTQAAVTTVASVSGSVGSVASFGTLVSDVAAAVWGAAARTLSAFSFTVAATVADKAGYSLDAAYDAAKSAAPAGAQMDLVNAPNATALTAMATASIDLANGVETGLTPRQAQRLLVAALAGKLSGAATTTITIRNYGDAKSRVIATVDADGNRTAITYDLT